MNNNCSNAIKHQTRYNQASLCQLIHLPLQILHLATQVLSFVVQCKKTNKIKQLSINLTDIKKTNIVLIQKHHNVSDKNNYSMC